MERNDVPFVAFEAQMVRYELTIRRLVIALVVAIALIFASNVAWLWFFNQFDIIGDTATSLCGGFAGVTAAINNGFSQAEIAANARAMNDMQAMFGIQSSLQNCCCENRAAIADLKASLAAEACADRAAVTAGVQRVLDELCQQTIDAKSDRILELQNALNMANLAASQTAQTAEIISKLPTTAAAGA